MVILSYLVDYKKTAYRFFFKIPLASRKNQSQDLPSSKGTEGSYMVMEDDMANDDAYPESEATGERVGDNSPLANVRVSVVEDNPDIAERMRRLFSGAAGFELMGLFGSAEKAVMESGIEKDRPDIALIDLELPGKPGDELVPFVREKLPDCKPVIFTVFEDQARIFNLMRMGVKGYILKDTPDELLLAELNVIAKGGATLTERIAHKILDTLNTDKQQPESPLTDREMEVLNLIGLGLKYVDIANRLEISHHTVRRHIENIYRKLEVKNKIEALKQAGKMGLLFNQND